jgi:uncharacterized integral membrane protein
MRSFFFFILVLLAVALGVFAIQNLDMVTIQFFDWTASYPLAIVLGIVYVLGMISGWTVVGFVRRSLRRAPG